MWDHRNTVNNAKETNMVSKEIDRKIDAEFRIGFATIQVGTGKLTRTRKTVLLKQSLAYRQNWLHSITVSREYKEVKAARNQPPQEIAETIGIVEWTKMGKPRRGERELERRITAWQRRQESIGDGEETDSGTEEED